MDYEMATPRPAALIESLRSIGYDLPMAIADIVDNSIAAEAKTIEITLHWAGHQSWIAILDDGIGMSEEQLFEAMRPGSQHPLEGRARSDLGRFGLGLKTASFSQARRLTVASRPQGGSVGVREWDLDYVDSIDEWRLRKRPAPGLEAWLDEVGCRPSGTAVVWTKLDRVTGGDVTTDAAAHNRFNDAIDHVRDYLALIFHRFLETNQLRIQINRRPIEPWNPFEERNTATYRSPIEVIPLGTSTVELRGFVLPHKDRLTEDEYRRLGGLNGWTAHQGFYLYRARRLVVFGDWLRLGSPNPWTRDEQFKLARIRLDIGNDADSAWQLDVKKSRARPPALIRERLQGLAANIRQRARAVFAHRGQYGPRATAPQEIERPWQHIERSGKRGYGINRSHPMVQSVLGRFDRDRSEVEALLRLLEETVPVEQIWLDTAEQSESRAVPYETVDSAVLRSDIRRTYEAIVRGGLSPAAAKARLRQIEPFNRYPRLIGEL